MKTIATTGGSTSTPMSSGDSSIPRERDKTPKFRKLRTWRHTSSLLKHIWATMKYTSPRGAGNWHLF